MVSGIYKLVFSRNRRRVWLFRPILGSNYPVTVLFLNWNMVALQVQLLVKTPNSWQLLGLLQQEGRTHCYPDTASYRGSRPREHFQTVVQRACSTTQRVCTTQRACTTQRVCTTQRACTTQTGRSMLVPSSLLSACARKCIENERDLSVQSLLQALLDLLFLDDGN